MIFQCHDQNTKPCLQQTAPQQPRDIFLSVQDGRSRVVDVARCCKYWRTETILSGGKVGSRWDQSPIWFTVPFKLLLGIGSGSPKSRIHPDPQSGQSAGFLSLIHKPLIIYSSPLDQHPQIFFGPISLPWISSYPQSCSSNLDSHVEEPSPVAILPGAGIFFTTALGSSLGWKLWKKALASWLSRFFGLVRWAKHGKTHLHPISWAIFRPQGLKKSQVNHPKSEDAKTRNERFLTFQNHQAVDFFGHQLWAIHQLMMHK